ncbi:hypothetical protein GCM10017600_27370 [Streptosporangium carneum]|uniref:Uncharacterized protein n=1 Tax=Streptosporangium carneum TaxID=47481 RepID=A0A9W6HZT6_9ACTN|nr:hypothetical protein GCM10017600_27370 [Streptosporangium carneum]
MASLVPPDADDDGDWRAEMAQRYPTASGFVKILTEVIDLVRDEPGEPVLERSGHPGAVEIGGAHLDPQGSRDHGATVRERRYAEALRGSRAVRMRSRPKTNSSAGSKPAATSAAADSLR